MSAKHKKKKTPPPQLSPEEQKKAQEEADAKAKKALQRDQQWMDSATAQMTADQKDEIFRYASLTCKNNTMKDGKIVMGCPMPDKLKLQYCVYADPFDCPNGNVGKGCALSPNVSKALTDAGTCIDGTFVSREEGGSYRSPYVPWGPISKRGKDGNPVLTTGNNSGVTIGTGVDLGSWTEANLTALQQAGVSKDTIDKLRPLIGKKREEACKALRAAKANGPLVFPQSDIELIDANAMSVRVGPLKKSFNKSVDRREAEYEAAIKKEQKKKAPDQTKIRDLEAKIANLKRFDNLKCSDQTILMSTLYHEGGLGSKYSRSYIGALMEGNSEGAKMALIAKTHDNNSLIANRGKQELQLFNSSSSPAQGANSQP